MTPELLLERRKAITATEMTVLLEASPWGSEEAIWLEKTQGISPAIKMNKSMAVGIILEPLLRKHFLSKHPELRMHNTGEKFIIHKTAHIGATPDGIAYDEDDRTPIGLEIKTTSRKWNDLPDRVLIQVNQGITCIEAKYWYVLSYFLAKGEIDEVLINAALGIDIFLNEDGVRIEKVMPDEALINKIITKGNEWWQHHVIEGFRPEPKPVKVIEE